jgi:hypothetical protein
MPKMPKQLSLQDQTAEFLLYTSPSGAIKVELFGVQRPVITKHLKNTFESNELQEKVVCSILEHTTGRSAVEN